MLQKILEVSSTFFQIQLYRSTISVTFPNVCQFVDFKFGGFLIISIGGSKGKHLEKFRSEISGARRSSKLQYQREPTINFITFTFFSRLPELDVNFNLFYKFTNFMKTQPYFLSFFFSTIDYSHFNFSQDYLQSFFQGHQDNNNNLWQGL